MPQWSRDRTVIRAAYPDEWAAGTCSRAHAALLLRYDHHVVRVGGRRALLLTYAWLPEPDPAEADALAFAVSFTYVRGHPPAPAAVQAVVDGIAFRPSPAPGPDAPAAERRAAGPTSCP